MSYSWEEIKEVIEIVENKQATDEFHLLEEEAGLVKITPPLTERTASYLEFLGELSVGVTVGILTVLFNFLLFNWLLHIEF